MISIAICDDAVVLVDKLTEYLEKYKEDVNEEFRILKFYNGSDLLEQRQNLDLIFLDIKMPGLNGIQVAEKIRKQDKKVNIIFLTSLLQYAIEGYKVNAINYIVKPINYKRLKSEMDNWFIKYRQTDEPFIIVNNDNGKYKILLKSLKYAETYNRNLLLHTEKEDIICYRKMRDLEQELLSHGFSRCHNGYLINLFYLETVEKMEAELVTGERIPISKLKKKEFMENLAAYWGNRL